MTFPISLLCGVTITWGQVHLVSMLTDLVYNGTCQVSHILIVALTDTWLWYTSDWILCFSFQGPHIIVHQECACLIGQCFKSDLASHLQCTYLVIYQSCHLLEAAERHFLRWRNDENSSATLSDLSLRRHKFFSFPHYSPACLQEVFKLKSVIQEKKDLRPRKDLFYCKKINEKMFSQIYS